MILYPEQPLDASPSATFVVMFIFLVVFVIYKYKGWA